MTPPPVVPEEPLRPEAGPPPSLLRRVFEMPFTPALWAQAAGWRVGALILPLVVLTVLLGSAVAIHRTILLRTVLRSWGETYAHPAVIVEKGVLRVEGDRVIRYTEGDQTLLVDPNETIPLASLTTSDSLVFRKRVMIRKAGGRDQEVSLQSLQEALGVDPLRIDRASLREFEERRGGAVQLAAFAVLMVFILLGEIVSGTAIVLISARLALALRGPAQGAPFAAAVRVALAAYSLIIVIDTVLDLVGLSRAPCAGFLLWPMLLAPLVAWRLGAPPA